MLSEMSVDRLKRVKQAVLDHPNNVCMSRYFDSRTGYNAFDSAVKYECDSACCIAGHTIVLFKPDLTVDEKIDKGSGLVAAELLGISERTAHQLFFTGGWPAKFYRRYRDEGMENNPKLSQLMADVIDDFIERNK